MIIGSTVIKHWFPEFREPKDFDIMSKELKMTKSAQNYWVDSFELLIKDNKDDRYLDPDNLLTLKASHFGFNIHWEKTAYDVLFLQSKGLKIKRNIYFELVKDWTKIHGARWATLKNKDSKNFFQDAVKRKYIHDDIHAAVCAYDKPLYERILKEKGKVSCCEQKFNQLSQQDKINLVKEEVWVTALERFLIPNDFKFSQKRAYYLSLKKLVTTMSSGWFKFFVIDNFSQLYYNDDVGYVEKFRIAEQNNKLRKI